MSTFIKAAGAVAVLLIALCSLVADLMNYGPRIFVFGLAITLAIGLAFLKLMEWDARRR